MTLHPDRLYRALSARDARFDGVFFVGVRTTGVYCRPVCTARTPGRDRCTFFHTAAEAERAGFRACFRCRPELAPGNAIIDAVPNLVRRAIALIEQGFLNDRDVDALGVTLGVTGRHLRRAMEHELGLSPIQLAQTHRLALAKRLLQDTRLPIADVAFTSGFQSVRRFNASFAERFGRQPSEVRRAHGRDDAPTAITLRLDYREPFDWDALLAFLAARSIPGVELVEDREYRRVVFIDGKVGTVRVRRDPTRPALWANVSLSLSGVVMKVVKKLRVLFDLDARPDVIAAALSRDALLRPLVARSPGLRLPGAFDPFEMMVRAVLGQQVTVRGATTLAGRLVQRFGEQLPDGEGGLTHRFPTAAELATQSGDVLSSIGMPRRRGECLRAIAEAFSVTGVRASTGSARTGGPPADCLARETLLALPGIGAWTAEYVAMRALHDPDAFPASDLGIRKALGGAPPKRADELSRAWSPWRSYAVMHLWSSLSKGGA